eukprot:14995-Eustigmatos_ZCMA.PRE.1
MDAERRPSEHYLGVASCTHRVGGVAQDEHPGARGHHGLHQVEGHPPFVLAVDHWHLINRQANILSEYLSNGIAG